MAGVTRAGWRLEFRILGSLEVLAAGEPVALGAPKERALLALLLIHRNEPVTTARLVEELWAGQAPQRASGALQVYVSHLRKLLEPERGRKEPAAVLRSSPSGYLLAVEQGACDVDRFVRLYEEGAVEVASAPERATASLREALALWRGSALADFVYEGWAQAEIARLEELRLVCVEERIDADLGRGRHGELVGELEALVGEQPLRERLRGQLMLALYRSGRQAEALEAYQQARTVLVDELGIEPSPQLQELNRAILNQDKTLAPERTASHGAPVRLPMPPTPLVGRERELAELAWLVGRADVRLLTLTGPGGTGKTRLALQLGSDLADSFPDGVWFVNLAALVEPALVVPTIAETLGVKEQPGRSITESLAERLRDKQTLLLLDNFEQVAEAAAALAELLTQTTTSKLLVTSRVRLHLSAEHEYPVAPLSENEAMLLFAERAQAVQPTFTINGDRHLFAEICRRLDRLPLAIELAAARIKLLPAEALLERLDQRLKVLAGGARDLPARQQTLRATIDWSYSLLGSDEQTLFARLAVFAGGRTLEAIEAVCNRNGELDTLEAVASLVDMNLLHTEQSSGGEPRFIMLETIHEYARELLARREERDELRRLHAEHFALVAEQAESALVAGRDQRAWLSQLEAEQDNMRAALAGSRGFEVNEYLPRIAVSLATFWEVRGFFSEGRAWLEAALDMEPLASLRARALVAVARLAGRQGDREAQETSAREAVSVARQLDDRNLLAKALIELGGAACDLARYGEARTLYEEAFGLARELADPRQERACINNLGTIALEQGDYGLAMTMLSRSMELARASGDAYAMAITLFNLGLASLAAGTYDIALTHARESLRLAAQIDYRICIAGGLDLLAKIAAAQADFCRAAHLFAKSKRLLEEYGGELSPADSAQTADTVRGVCTKLGEEQFHTFWAAGEALGRDEVIAYALNDAAALAEPVIATAMASAETCASVGDIGLSRY